ncbi:hypothetical protein O7632_11735 [Solwaraspora sp. WMMD406]|uniref:hypothetical protein n=1 Tax=Solwaraspora sp. WMMD406 TaxID=3016095 RepID=UPI002416F543|nr:hypothetical protein [Solwaraspora sp. WMMD406]MDG4764770.1 hypothetical protein [Solwaraspora sp. WMMD406]
MTLIPATSTVLAAVDPRLRHWFLIPVTVCGVLIGVDAVEWLRRRRDVFDPQAILGLFGVHFYYVAPVLHVLLDYWPALLYPSASGWRPALGAMALVNMAGLAVYRLVVSLPRRGHRVARPARWSPARFHAAAGAAVMIGVAAFAIEVLLLGGPSGFLSAMTQDRSALTGMGWLLLISESFPLLAFCLIMVRWRHLLRRRVDLVVLLLVALVAVQFLVGGLRGSRSAVLWPLVLGLVLVHLLVVPITRKAFVASAAAVVVFVYAYGLYKGAGVEVVDIAKGTRTIEEVSAETGRDLPTVLLSDLGRADIQALLLDRHRAGITDGSFGSTYVAAPLSLVPGPWGAEWFRSKTAVGTDALYGHGTYASGVSSQRVFGVTGEAILNFGPVGGLVSFLLLGLFLRFATRYYARAKQHDALTAKLLCLPLCAITIILVTADLDNILAFYLGEVLPLALVVLGARALTPPARSLPVGPLPARSLPLGLLPDGPATIPNTDNPCLIP